MNSNIPESKILKNLILHNEFELYIDNSGEVIRLSKGWKEETNPLPIINAIAQQFIKSKLNNSENVNSTQKLEEMTIRNVFNLNTWGQVSFSNHLAVGPEGDEECVMSTSSGDYILEIVLRNKGLKKIVESSVAELGNLNLEDNFLEVPIKDEHSAYYTIYDLDMISLIVFATIFSNDKATFNTDLVNLGINMFNAYYKQSRPRKSLTSTTFTAMIGEFYSKRISELPIKTLLVSRKLNIQDKDCVPTMSLALALKLTKEVDLLDLAWFELFHAHINRMPVSLCQFCGKVYRLDGVHARGRYGKGICGDEECKKKQKRNKEQIDRFQNVELQREKNREKQRVFRLKKKFLKEELYKEEFLQMRKDSDSSKTVAELSASIFAQRHGLDFEKVKSWIPQQDKD